MVVAFEPLEDDREGSDPRVKFFAEINELARRQGKRIPWAERVRLVHEHFPSTVSLDWRKALSNPETLPQILRDILRLEQADPGRSGPRPAPDYEEGLKTLRRINGEDYSTIPFHEAFQVLARGYSIRHLSRKTQLSFGALQRYLQGDRQPGMEEMARIARAFGKDPWYFAEYRLQFIVTSIVSKLATAPEATIVLYRKLLARP
jgi:lambda repressor-like predicted transcriptional regulator